MNRKFKIGRRPRSPHDEKPVVYIERWIVRVWRCDSFEFPKHPLGAPGCSSSSSPQDDTGSAFELDRRSAKALHNYAKRLHERLRKAGRV
jgi:hypothetical protein